MSLLASDDKVYVYRYAIEEFSIIDGPKTISLGPSNVLEMQIENNYDINLFPLFKVILRLNSVTADYIISNSDSVKFKVRVVKYGINKSKDHKKTLKTNFINSTFTTYMDKDYSGFNKKTYKRNLKVQGITADDDISSANNTFELFLFNDEYVSKLKGTLNFVLSSATPATAIAYVLAQLNIKNVLMSPMDNKSSISPFILPEMSGVNALSYIDQTFGTYKNGAMMYFGLSRGYILNYKGGCTAYAQGENTKVNFLVNEDDGNEDTQNGVAKKASNPNEYYIVTTEKCLNISTQSSITNVIGGTNAKVVNSNTGAIDSSNSSAKTKGGTQYKSTMISNSNNPYISSIYAAKQYSGETIISLYIRDTLAEAFEPNKDFSFVFENSTKNKKYKGHYKISKSSMMFTGAPELKCNTNLVFRRVL